MNKIAKCIEGNSFVFVFLTLLIIVDRVVLLTDFNFQYTGSDDLIFWLSSKDYMNGIFHEPYFYGQNYNFMLESLPAILLIKSGIPSQYALPISTSILALFPYFLFSFVFCKRGKIIESLIFLFVLLTLPVEFGMLTSMTRGFVTGLFFSALLVYCIIKPERKISIILFGISFFTGYLFNPNSLILSFPVGIYLLFINYRKPSFYLINLLIGLPLLSIEYFSKRFYEINPDYKVCWLWDLNYKFSALFKGFGTLDKFFNYLMPVFWPVGWFSIPLLFFLGFRLIKINRLQGISIISGAIFILALMGINKVNDDIGTVFLCSSRMFLGIPLLLALAFSWSKNIIPLTDKQWKYLLLIAGIIIFIIKIGVYKPIIKYNTYKTNWGPVSVRNIKELTNECAMLDSIANKYKVDIILFVPNKKLSAAKLEFYNYGCAFIINNFKNTLLTIYEKRTWLYLDEKKAVRKTVLIFGGDISPDKIVNHFDCLEINDNPKMILIDNNSLPTEELLDQLGINLKRNIYQ